MTFGPGDSPGSHEENYTIETDQNTGVQAALVTCPGRMNKVTMVSLVQFQTLLGSECQPEAGVMVITEPLELATSMTGWQYPLGCTPVGWANVKLALAKSVLTGLVQLMVEPVTPFVSGHKLVWIIDRLRIFPEIDAAPVKPLEVARITEVGTTDGN